MNLSLIIFPDVDTSDAFVLSKFISFITARPRLLYHRDINTKYLPPRAEVLKCFFSCAIIENLDSSSIQLATQMELANAKLDW